MAHIMRGLWLPNPDDQSPTATIGFFGGRDHRNHLCSTNPHKPLYPPSFHSMFRCPSCLIPHSGGWGYQSSLMPRAVNGANPNIDPASSLLFGFSQYDSPLWKVGLPGYQNFLNQVVMI